MNRTKKADVLLNLRNRYIERNKISPMTSASPAALVLCVGARRGLSSAAAAALPIVVQYAVDAAAAHASSSPARAAAAVAITPPAAPHYSAHGDVRSAARSALLSVRGLKRRQTAQLFGGSRRGGGGFGSLLAPQQQRQGPRRNALALGGAFPPRSRGASLIQGGGGGGEGGDGGRRLPPSLLQGRPRQQQQKTHIPSSAGGSKNGQARQDGTSGRRANGHKINGSGLAYTADLAKEPGNGCGNPVRRKFESDLIVVLDMDECLVHSQFLSHQQSSMTARVPPSVKDRYRQAESSRPVGSPAFDTDDEAEQIVSSRCEYFRVQLPDGDLVHVNKRPSLDDFLSLVCSRFETHIFTAAVGTYASPLLDRLDPTGELLRGRYYRESCSYDPELGVYVKDLGAALGGRQSPGPWGGTTRSAADGGYPDRASDLAARYDESRVVLVDNNPLSFLAQPSNGILVNNFYDDPKDATLEAVVELLDELDGADDVRPVLEQKFGLAEALGDVVKLSGEGGWR